MTSLMLVIACQKEDASYLHKTKKFPVQKISDALYSIRDLNLSTNVNILFVIDNSGSMDSIQQMVINNATIFMNEFVKYEYLNWRLGLISTDRNDRPYIGMTSSDILDSSTPDPVMKFTEAVRKLGTWGDSTEIVLGNIKDKISDYPEFLIDDAHFAVIMITDEEEQSMMTTNQMMEFLSQYVPAHKIIRFYGALNTKEHCSNNILEYVGSPYEDIINFTEGFMIPTCTPDFGKRLADIGTDIRSMIDQPRLMLKSRPKLSTIKIFYEDLELKGGAKEKGAHWFYDEYFNSINFYNLDFSKGDLSDRLRVTYEIEDGYNRSWERRNL